MKKITIKWLLFLHKIKINDQFLYIEPAYGYAEVKSIMEYKLVSINYYTDEFHLHNFETDNDRYLNIEKIIQLKAAQAFLRKALPNVPSNYRYVMSV